MTELVRRIFIDSRLRSINSRSNSDFSVDLPQEVAIPSGTQLRIDNLVMAHSWPTIDGRNDKLYIKEIVGGTSYHRIVQLRHGIFNKGSMVVQIQDQLRIGSHISDGQWVVGLVDNNVTFSTTSTTASAIIYSQNDIRSKNSIPVYYSFLGGYVESGYDFRAIWIAADVVEALPSQTADCCEMIGLMRTRLHVTPGVTVTCSHIDLQRHKSLYLCSDTLPSTSMDLRGRGDIIKQIVIGNAGPGQVIVDALPSMASFSHFISFTVLNNINFTIRSHDGQIANLYDHEVSFTIELLRPADQ
jgi:hypothetical protein